MAEEVSATFQPNQNEQQITDNPENSKPTTSEAAKNETQELSIEERDECTVFVGNVDAKYTEDEIKEIFSVIDKPVNITVKVHPGKPNGVAFVQFPNKEDVAKAKEYFSKTPVHDRLLRVKGANEPKSPKEVSNYKRDGRNLRVYDNRYDRDYAYHNRAMGQHYPPHRYPSDYNRFHDEYYRSNYSLQRDYYHTNYYQQPYYGENQMDWRQDYPNVPRRG